MKITLKRSCGSPLGYQTIMQYIQKSLKFPKNGILGEKKGCNGEKNLWCQPDEKLVSCKAIAHYSDSFLAQEILEVRQC